MKFIWGLRMSGSILRGEKNIQFCIFITNCLYLILILSKMHILMLSPFLSDQMGMCLVKIWQIKTNIYELIAFFVLSWVLEIYLFLGLIISRVPYANYHPWFWSKAVSIKVINCFRHSKLCSPCRQCVP